METEAATVRDALTLVVPSWAELVVSPAVAGLAALLVASVGVVATRSRSRVERRAALEDEARRAVAARRARSQAVDDRDRAQWWATYCWTVETLARLDPQGAERVLDALRDTAHDQATLALVEVRLRPGGHGREEPL